MNVGGRRLSTDARRVSDSSKIFQSPLGERLAHSLFKRRTVLMASTAFAAATCEFPVSLAVMGQKV
jgi:hypothetical protein